MWNLEIQVGGEQQKLAHGDLDGSDFGDDSPVGITWKICIHMKLRRYLIQVPQDFSPVAGDAFNLAVWMSYSTAMLCHRADPLKWQLGARADTARQHKGFRWLKHRRARQRSLHGHSLD